MSASTRWSRADALRRRAGALAGVVALALSAQVTADHLRVDAPPLPPAVAALAQGLQPQGGGELRFLGFPVYDGWYWGRGHAWTMAAPFALDLHYHRRIEGASIAERSVDEIARLGLGAPADLARWGAEMRRIFPDVRAGDRLTGLFLPPGDVRYFRNGLPIGEIVDPAFARAFFGIWLDPATSRADFRARLLGRQ